MYKINYRTSHQIRQSADRLLGAIFSDVDGNEEERRGTHSVFDGPSPTKFIPDGMAEEQSSVAAWLQKLDLPRHEICVIVRYDPGFDRALQAIALAGANAFVLTGAEESKPNHI